LNRGFAEVHAFPSLDQLLFLGDGASAMLAQSVHDDDEVLKALRHPEAFDAVAAANPDLAAWWSVLEPASEVFCLGRFPNRLRSPVRDGRPVVRGLVQVGDALAATNPTRGRGISMGLSAAGRLVDALAEHGPGDEAVLALGAWVERSLAVYYRETAAADEATTRRLRAGLRGRSVPGNAPSVELPADHPFDSGDLDRAAGSDPDLLRVLLRTTMLLDDDRRVASAEVAEQVRRALGSAPASVGGASPPRSGGLHDRAVVEELLAAYA
jgi:hypothetical protein